MKPERSIPRVCDPRPFFGSDACDDRICPLPIRLENCGFSLSQIEPVFAESFHDVRLVGNDHVVRQKGWRKSNYPPQGLGAPIVLARTDDQAPLSEINQGSNVAKS